MGFLLFSPRVRIGASPQPVFFCITFAAKTVGHKGNTYLIKYFLSSGVLNDTFTESRECRGPFNERIAMGPGLYGGLCRVWYVDQHFFSEHPRGDDIGSPYLSDLWIKDSLGQAWVVWVVYTAGKLFPYDALPTAGELLDEAEWTQSVGFREHLLDGRDRVGLTSPSTQKWFGVRFKYLRTKVAIGVIDDRVRVTYRAPVTHDPDWEHQVGPGRAGYAEFEREHKLLDLFFGDTSERPQYTSRNRSRYANSIGPEFFVDLARLSSVPVELGSMPNCPFVVEPYPPA